MTSTIDSHTSTRLFKVCRPNNDVWGRIGWARHHAILERRPDGTAFIHERIEGRAGLATITYDPQVHWDKIDPIQNVHAAMQRLNEVKKWGPYSLLSGNCEHAVNYIAHGTVRSMQVTKGVAFGAALIVGCIFILRTQRHVAVGEVV